MTSIAGAAPAGRTIAWAFAPFAVVGAVHLAAQAAALGDLDHATKPLLMPALAVPLVLAARRGPMLTLVTALVGVLFSWLGDVTVERLAVGLGFFLAAHVAYSAMFATGFRRRIPWWTAAYAGWWIALVAFLWPYLGALLVPVVVYGLALGTMAVLSTRGGPLTGIGGLCFVVSDSLLAVRLFTPWLQGTVADVVIMALYLAAQCLLVVGVLRHRAPRLPAPAPPSP